MRLVPRADIRPHQCAVFPQLGVDHHKGYFDTGNELVAVDPHIYISVEAVETMASALGWHSPVTLDQATTEIEQLREQLAAETARANDAQRKLDAIDVIESADFRARRKPGRKPAEVAA